MQAHLPVRIKSHSRGHHNLVQKLPASSQVRQGQVEHSQNHS